MSPVRQELSFYVPDCGILHSHRRENLRSYIELTGWALILEEKKIAILPSTSIYQVHLPYVFYLFQCISANSHNKIIHLHDTGFR
jgi:hypothetical protein